MKHLEIYENFKVNESIWSDFLLLAKKGEEKMFTFFAPKYVKELKDKVDSMTDLEKIMILNKVEKKIKTWRRGKNLLALIALLHFIIYLILGQHLSELGISDNIPVNSSITMIYWTMALFMQNRNEIIKEKIQEILKKIK